MSTMSFGTAATPESLQEVSFVNPNAQQARSHRRRKLAASRARMSAMAASGLGFPGGDGSGATSAGGESNVRKQKRMLRNRESAALSRKRKNDLIGELEIQVEALKEENRRLRQRVDVHESDAQAAGGGGADLEPLPLSTHCARVRSPGISAESTGLIAPPTAVVSPSPPRNHVFDPTASPWGCPATATAPAAAACFNIVSRPAVFA